MSESLQAACGEFEQIIIAQMLRSAGFGRGSDVTSDDGGNVSADSVAGNDAVQQLFVQALSGALERAGGIGLQRSLYAAMAAGKNE